jgi:hypothetical protein
VAGDYLLAQAQEVFSLFLSYFHFYFQFEISKPNSDSCFALSIFSSVKINTNVNITSIVSNIIIYYFPCYVFMGRINGFLKIPILFFSIPLFIFQF